MKRRKSHDVHTGFTLIETLVALSISVLILMVTIQITIGGLQKLRIVQYDQAIHANTSSFLDTLRYTLKSAKRFETDPSDDTTLTIRFSDYSAKVVKKDGDGISLDGSKITNGDVRVTDLHFTVVGSSTRVAFTMEAGPHAESVFSATTTIAKRN